MNDIYDHKEGNVLIFDICSECNGTTKKIALHVFEYTNNQ